MPRPRSYNETEVLERAVELFRKRGFEGTSLPALTERLGICRQSLYNTFGDKRGLYLAALRHYGQREVDAKLSLLATDGSRLENLRTVLRGLAALAAQCPADGCLTAGAILESAGDADALEVVERQVEQLEDGFRDALERALRAGELRPSSSPIRLARALTTTCYGLGVLCRLPGSGPRIGAAVDVMLQLLEAATAEPHRGTN